MRKMGYKVQSMLVDDRMDGDSLSRANEALRVSLRLGESAIVLGEVRGEEARTLYQSMRTGRAGSSILGTIHGDSARTVYERVVHDMGISPEAFMATDILVTLGVVPRQEDGGAVQEGQRGGGHH
jgi:type IV secretory pathway ATPase VirB11/archaellum biosynthesis ATPase